VSDAFNRTLTPGFWPFVDLHAALAHVSAGKRSRMQRLVQAIQRCAQGTDYAAMRARHITAPGLRALDAWAEGRYAEAADVMAAVRPILGEAGGSSVQLEVFDRIEQDARGRHAHAPAPKSRAKVKLIEAMLRESDGKRLEERPSLHAEDALSLEDRGSGRG
jgi:hypothetical protein